MKAAGKLVSVQGKLTDVWPPDIVRRLGKIGIAFAQLEWAVFVVAKRIDNRMRMAEFAIENRNKIFTDWCNFIVKKSPADTALVKCIEEARKLAWERNDLFHGIWFKEVESGRLVLFRIPPDGAPRELSLDPNHFAGLVRRIRATRDALLVRRGVAAKSFEWSGDRS
jgi:hypothetical protein